MVLNDVGADLYKRMGLRPGFYPTPENKGEMMAVPEGDLGVGLAVYILGKLTGDHVNIIEPAHVEDDDSLMVVHAGPNDYTDTRGKTIIARDIRFAKSKWKHEQSLYLLVKKVYPNAIFQYRQSWLSRHGGRKDGAEEPRNAESGAQDQRIHRIS